LNKDVNFVTIDTADQFQHNLYRKIKMFKLNKINKGTKTYKLFNALQAGETLTASQAEKRFGIKNISAEVSRIRQSGYPVYANSRKAGNGVVVTEYVMSHASRTLVAAGYKALAMGLV